MGRKKRQHGAALEATSTQEAAEWYVQNDAEIALGPIAALRWYLWSSRPDFREAYRDMTELGQDLRRLDPPRLPTRDELHRELKNRRSLRRGARQCAAGGESCGESPDASDDLPRS